MNESEYTVDHIFFEVCKDIWVAGKAAGTEGSASLSLVLVSIYPSVFQETFAENI